MYVTLNTFKDLRHSKKFLNDKTEAWGTYLQWWQITYKIHNGCLNWAYASKEYIIQDGMGNKKILSLKSVSMEHLMYNYNSLASMCMSLLGTAYPKPGD